MVCVVDANRNNYRLYLNDADLLHSTVIALHQLPVGSESLPIDLYATGAELLHQWSPMLAFYTVEEVVELFGLEETLDVPLRDLDKSHLYRIQLLKAVLENAPVIEFVAPWRICGFSDLLHGAYTLAQDRSELLGLSAPAFVAYDPGYLPALAFMVDRVLAHKEDTLVELLADF